MLFIGNVDVVRDRPLDDIRLYVPGSQTVYPLRDHQKLSVQQWRTGKKQEAATGGTVQKDNILVYVAATAGGGVYVAQTEMSTSDVLCSSVSIPHADPANVFIRPLENVLINLRPFQVAAIGMLRAGNTRAAALEGIVQKGDSYFYVDSQSQVLGALCSVTVTGRGTQNTVPRAPPTRAPATGRKIRRISATPIASNPAVTPASPATPAPVAPPSSSARSARAALVAALVDVYHAPYRPPALATTTFVDHFEMYAPRAKLIIPRGTDRELAVRAAAEREPVNIAMNRRYEPEKLLELLGYRVSGYQSHFEETGELAPNIAVYTLTPVDMGGGKTRDVHIYHAVGAALDTRRQADYKVFSKLPGDELVAFYAGLFARLFAFATQEGFRQVVLSLVGMNNFAEALPAARAHWATAFEATVSRLPSGLTLLAMGTELAPGDPSAVAVAALRRAGVKDIGWFPGCVVAAPNALFVNAWDPHSFPGNGNAGDPSLDGRVGRISAVQFLGCGKTNPHLLENVVKL